MIPILTGLNWANEVRPRLLAERPLPVAIANDYVPLGLATYAILVRDAVSNVEVGPVTPAEPLVPSLPHRNATTGQ